MMIEQDFNGILLNFSKLVKKNKIDIDTIKAIAEKINIDTINAIAEKIEIFQKIIIKYNIWR